MSPRGEAGSQATGMFEFALYRTDSGAVSGVDAGDMSFVFDSGQVSSHGDARRTMKIYIALVDLIDGLLHLETLRRYEFAAVGSAFIMDFQWTKAVITVRSAGRLLAVCSPVMLLGGLEKGIDRFIDAGHALPVADPVYGDLQAARKALRKTLARGG